MIKNPENRTIDELVEECGKRAGDNFKVGLSCSECVFKAWLDMGLTEFPPEVVALASGFGGGLGTTRHTCGAVCGGMMIVGTTKGRKDPFKCETFEGRVEELNREPDGVYACHREYVRDVISEWGSLDCRDLILPFKDFHSIERRRNCKQIIKACAMAGARHALEGELGVPDQKSTE